jgi:FkbM family methyltransferase
MQKYKIRNLIQTKLKSIANIFLNVFGLHAVSDNERSLLQKYSTQNYAWDLEFLADFSRDDQNKLIAQLPFSQSQLRQDLFVLTELNFKSDGFFVEFGATDGKSLSNTHLLANRFNWKGILAEPARIWHKSLIENRPESTIVKDCVWITSGSTLEFNETDVPELSTIDELSETDQHARARINGRKYSVTTISLNDLLDSNNAPKDLDYLSIDTEGSEFEILSNLNFTKYRFKVITCEHNYTPNREKIANLLIENGYVRVRTSISKFDDWYVLSDLEH